MTRWTRLLTPTFVGTLIVWVGSLAGVLLLRATVLACTVGFNTSGGPLSTSQAARCPGDEIASALLLSLVLVTSFALLWLAVRFFRTPGPRRARGEGGDVQRRIDGPAASDRPTDRSRRSLSYTWIFLLVALFFLATFSSASWQYLHLPAISTDLTVNQQALSSTLQGGKPFPFYEAVNCMRHGQCSYLQVHQTFIAYGAAVAYALDPTPFGLFALQSLALGLAALPLYALAVDVIGSRRLSLLVAGAYLAWFPISVGANFAFHWESFLPVELLTVFWLWYRHRYLLAVPVIVLAFLTIEVTTVMVFFIGLYFASIWFYRALRLFVHSIIGESGVSKSLGQSLRLWGRWVGKAVKVPEVYASLALMVGSFVAYVLLRLFVLDGSALFGLPPVPAAYALPLNSPNRAFDFSVKALMFAWTSKLWFWVVVFFTVGFIPLFAPRALILIAPWVAFTWLNVTVSFWRFGSQYPFVPAAALFIAFAFGFNQLYSWLSRFFPQSTRHRSHTAKTAPRVSEREGLFYPLEPVHLKQSTLNGSTTSPTAVPQPSSRRSRASRSVRAAGILSVAVVIIIGGNLCLNPLSPVANSVTTSLGPPFPYDPGINSSSPTSSQYLQQLISLVPRNAVVTAPLPVYVWLADDPYSYPMTSSLNNPYNLSLLPANIANRLAYVVLPYNTPAADFSPALLQTLYDRSNWGVRGCVSDSATGGVELLERGYAATPEVFGPGNSLCPNYFSAGAGLTAGPNAKIYDNASSPSGVVVRSTPCSANNSSLWAGPGIQLAPGRYSLSVVLNAYSAPDSSCAGLGSSPHLELLKVNVTGENVSSRAAVRIISQQFSVGEVCTPVCGDWFYWNSTFKLPSATKDLSVSGWAIDVPFVVQASYVLITPNPG